MASMEELILGLTAALDRNTEALGGAKPAATKSAAGKPAATKPAAADKPTADQVKAALMEVKDAHGRPAAMKIVKEAGNATELPGIKPARYTAVLAACAEIMAPDDGDNSDDATGEDDEL